MKVETFTQKYKPHLNWENTAVLLIILAGVILRLRQYLTGRSLWVDEAMLALNIVNRDFVGLFNPLDFDQGAPVGFLLVEKIFNLLLGRNEFALRLFPLLLGLLSLWMFYLLLKQLSGGMGMILVLALFAISPRLIYYSSEVKQYIADVTAIIVLLRIAVAVFEKPSKKGLLILAVAGTFALWLSHPSIFILAGIGATLFFLYLRKRDWENLRLAVGMGILWLANIGVLYSLTLGDLRANAYMREYWRGAFAPLPPWSDWGWYWSSFQANLSTNLAITYLAWIALFLMLAGWIVLFLQKRFTATMVAWSLLFILLGSWLELYPSLERMALFLVPIGLLLIGKTLEFVVQKLRGHPIAYWLAIMTLGGYLFYGPLMRTFDQFVSPKYFEHIRPTMEYLQSEWREGDAMFITNGGVPAFEYYAPFYGLETAVYVSGHREDYKDPSAMLERLEPFKGQRRIWILMSHVYEKGNFNEKDYLLEHLDKIGNKKREFREPGTSVYLYLYDLGE